MKCASKMNLYNIGMLVSIVPSKYRTVSSSISVMVFNLFGYFLSLTLSGYLMQVNLCHIEIVRKSIKLF